MEQSDEVIVFPNSGPADYAEKIWKSVASNPVMTPLDELIPYEELERDVKPLYMQRVVQVAQPWKSDEGIRNPYTMLWVDAQK